MAEKENFKVGDRVKFLRSHDKTVRLTGHIVRIHENDDDCVDIETEPDGKLVEVATVETAHAADVELAVTESANEGETTEKSEPRGKKRSKD